MKNNDHNVFQCQVTAESFRETPQRRWPCRDCGRYFSCAAEVAAHRVSATRAVQLVCGQCGDLVSPGDMPTHMATSHAEEVGDHGEVIIFNYQKYFAQVRCGECGDWCGDLANHAAEVHGGHSAVLTLGTSTCAGDGTSLITR